MADLLIRHLSHETKERLGKRAEAHGRSLSAEAAAILESALDDYPEDMSVSDAFRRIVEKYGPLDIELPPREIDDRPPPSFE